jgi:hypothetical protein
MSEVTTIRPADLRTIERALEQLGTVATSLHRRVEIVDDRVTHLQRHQEELADNLGRLADDFAAFVEADTKQKELQLAETRVVKVRQELETRFGHYADVRRRATGLLQALDANLVSHDTIQHTTEDVMMSVPGYWLAPALVALAGWIRGDRPLAERAVAEALRRDDYKTSLYFALVLRRCGRAPAASAWLHRFFSQQNPAELDREFVVLLDSVANGVFGLEGRVVAHQNITEWLVDLCQRAGFVEEQEGRWATALSSLTPVVADHGYPLLAAHSPTWPALRDSLADARLHEQVGAYFTRMFAGKIIASARLVSEVDAMLESLVTNFDDEELPLRQAERQLQLIIDYGGDRREARERFEAEQHAFAEKVSFTALLTNAAMHPEISQASLATQRYAVALSRDWVVRAHETVTARSRAMVPWDIAVRIEGWTGSTDDGTNEAELAESQRAFFEAAEAKALEEEKLSTAATIAPFAGGILVLYGLIKMVSVLAILAGLGAIAYWYLEGKKLEKRRAGLAERFRQLREGAARTLNGVLAEVVRYRVEWQQEDQKAEEVRTLLQAITPEQYALVSQTEPDPAFT